MSHRAADPPGGQSPPPFPGPVGVGPPLGGQLRLAANGGGQPGAQPGQEGCFVRGRRQVGGEQPVLLFDPARARGHQRVGQQPGLPVGDVVEHDVEPAGGHFRSR